MSKKENKKYSGITTKTLKNGETAIMVRFKYEGKTYPLKNFTKLFNCRTELQAFDTLNKEVKKLLTDGKDPFNAQTRNLDYYFYERYDLMIKKNKWRKDTTARNYLQFYKKYITKPLGWKKLSKIKYTDLDDILNSIAHTSGTQHNQLKKILNPIYKEELRRGEVDIIVYRVFFNWNRRCIYWKLDIWTSWNDNKWNYWYYHNCCCGCYNFPVYCEVD